MYCLGAVIRHGRVAVARDINTEMKNDNQNRSAHELRYFFLVRTMYGPQTNLNRCHWKNRTTPLATRTSMVLPTRPSAIQTLDIGSVIIIIISFAIRQFQMNIALLLC